MDGQSMDGAGPIGGKGAGGPIYGKGKGKGSPGSPQTPTRGGRGSPYGKGGKGKGSPEKAKVRPAKAVRRRRASRRLRPPAVR